MNAHYRFLPLLCALGAVAVPARVAGADALTKSQIACLTLIDAAGAGVGNAAAETLFRCLRLAAMGRLPAGQTADQCLAADSGGRVSRAAARVAKVFMQKCRTSPPFGLTDPATVNGAFSHPVVVSRLFGPGLDAAVIRAGADREGAACQRAVTRAAMKITLAKVHEFDSCVAVGLRTGTITTADGLRVCVNADPRGRVAARRAAAQALANERCANVPVAQAFPGACATAPLAGLFDCLEEHLQCGACRALSRATAMGEPCHRFENGVAAYYCGERPPTTQSVARQWDEQILAAIRRDNPRPVVHARNLFHTAIAMYDAWAAYDDTAKPYLAAEHATSGDVEGDRALSISFAAYRVLSHRYDPALAIGGAVSRASFDAKMADLGLDRDYTSTVGSSPIALGNRIGAAVIAFGQSDGSNEAANYADPTYTPVNAPLVVKLPGIQMTDPNRWQPLALDVFIGQNGVPLPDRIQTFVGSRWGEVTPFALTRSNPNEVYLDPGPPPLLAGAGDAAFKENALAVLRLSSRLTPDDPAMIDLSPAAPDGYGDNPLGTNDGHGYPANPVTGQPYTPQLVKRGDFGRVLAEFWADGPSSETPPGHWNVIANYVSDHPLLEKRFGGAGPILSDLEWDVKTYFAVNGALHDAAIAAWGVKRKYDSVRPISMLRYLGTRGQSTDPNGPAYDPNGMLLEPGLVEVITPESAAPGGKHEGLPCGIGKIAFYTWPGEPADVTTQYSGIRWRCADSWVPYQRKTFVTPPFAAYVSGHSTFSRASAEVLTALTGSPYFPGGLGEFVAPQQTYLKFEIGPSTEVRLQWASYYDAADQAGLSRLWGGIHVAPDDFAGRIMGHQIGLAAFAKAQAYFDGTAVP